MKNKYLNTKYDIPILAGTAAILLAIAWPAFADNLTQSGVGNVANQNSNNGNTNISGGVKAYGGDAWASAKQQQLQLQRQIALGGTVTGSGNSSSGGNMQQVDMPREPRQTPPAIAPSMNPAWSCSAVSQLAASGPGFSVSGGSSYDSETCATWYNHDKFMQYHFYEAANGALCDNPKFAKYLALEYPNPCANAGASDDGRDSETPRPDHPQQPHKAFE